MSREPSGTVLGELLARQLDTWLTGALRRSRRVTLALAYGGAVGGDAETVLRSVGQAATRVRGHRLTVVVLGGDADLPARLGPVGATLPAEVTVHAVPGDPGRLPVVLKAAGAAGAPVLAALHDPAGTDLVGPAARAVAATGRPAEMLLAAGVGVRAELTAAGFPLVGEVETVSTDDATPQRYALGTGSDRSLEAFKEALWRVGATAGLRYRDVGGVTRALEPEPDPAPLVALLRAELIRSGPRTVTELRRHALTATAYRATDAVRALTALLATGAVRRVPADGRLAGDVVIHADAAQPSRSG